MAKYSGSYRKGSSAGSKNNLLGKEAEDILEKCLKELKYYEGKSYFKQRRIPYLSPDRFKTISSSFIFPINNEDIIKFLYIQGGPNITEDFIITVAGEESIEYEIPVEKIKTIISVTQANPAKPGHSIENKLHQALGELFLHKVHNPNCRSILFVGGTENSWGTDQQLKKYGKSYTLETLSIFYDYTIAVWDPDILQKLEIALNCPLKNNDFWLKEKSRVDSLSLYNRIKGIPNKNLRSDFYNEIIVPSVKEGINDIEQIKNPILRYMALVSKRFEGKFHIKLIEGDIEGLEVDRSFNNPPEAAVCMILEHLGISFRSDYIHGKKSVLTDKNLLYELGFDEMHRYTDFILKTNNGKTVYIECKSAGGGNEGGHKHITDRAREQVARSVLERTSYRQSSLINGIQNYEWIFILDADWETPKTYPQKFIHTLQIAGATGWFTAHDLVDSNYNLNFDCVFVKWLQTNFL